MLKLLINKQKVKSKVVVCIQQKLNGGEGNLLEIEKLVSKYQNIHLSSGARMWGYIKKRKQKTSPSIDSK
jgi:hypothetical protein